MKKLLKSLVVRASGETVMVRSLERVLLPLMWQASEGLGPDARVLDVGSKNAIYRQIFAGTQFLTLDIVPDYSPDLVGDIHDLDAIVEPGSFDVIICTEVLEHVRDPHLAVEQMRKALKPGGVLLASTPWFAPYHPDPTDFWRYTVEGWSVLAKDYASHKVHAHGGRLLTLWYLVSCSLVPLRLLDRLIFALSRRGGDHFMPLGFVIEARR